MAWPESGDVVVTEANKLKAATTAMFNDIAEGAQSVKLQSVSLNPQAEMVPDPDWVDPGDGSEPPLVERVTAYEVKIYAELGGVYAPDAVDKLKEVKEALGI